MYDILSSITLLEHSLHEVPVLLQPLDAPLEDGTMLSDSELAARMVFSAHEKMFRAQHEQLEVCTEWSPLSASFLQPLVDNFSPTDTVLGFFLDSLG